MHRIPISSNEFGKRPHRHSWQALGADVLHVGKNKQGQAIREVRLVRRCSCGKLKVSLSRHLVYEKNARTTPGAKIVPKSRKPWNDEYPLKVERVSFITLEKK